MRIDRGVGLVLLPLLAACGGAAETGRVASAGTRPAMARPPLTRPAVTGLARPPLHRPPTAQIQSLPGLEGIIGSTPAQLVQQFGEARLDVWEGDARKLQFTGVPCVLDVYLYPVAPGREPQATYVDA
ncbi:MAG: hypothetical protein JF593_13880, partial [Novosphingobium sp.]|nr:hypothetical protein [Novosphingobium sp.]